MQMCKARVPREVREAAIRRYLNTDISYRRLAAELDISPWTLRDWVGGYQSSLVGSGKKDVPRSTDMRPAREKLSLLLQARALTEEQLGEFLRREGIREGDLERWEQEVLEGLERGPAEDAQNRRIRELEAQLHKSQKRLKEADALLELQKKVQALWEGEDDDTSHS